MRTPEETASYMIEHYGKDAEIHCVYAITNNDGVNPRAAVFWRVVYEALQRLKRDDS